MQTIGFIGVGKIGLPICENLIKSGYRVLGYRRGSLAEFEKIGGVPAKSPADIGAQADIVLSCVPHDKAMDEVVNGPKGLITRRAAGQIIVELGSHPVPDKQKHVAPLAAKGAAYIDGEVSGTPGMVAARKAVIYLGGDADACQGGRARDQRLRRHVPLFRTVRCRDQGQAGQQLLVGINIAATAEAMALGLQAGVDVDLMIKAIACGSGGSNQFGIRAPWMAQRKFLPVQGSAPGCCSTISIWQGTGPTKPAPTTPMLDRAVEVFERCIDMGSARRDVAVMIEVINSTCQSKRKADR